MIKEDWANVGFKTVPNCISLLKMDVAINQDTHNNLDVIFVAHNTIFRAKGNGTIVGICRADSVLCDKCSSTVLGPAPREGPDGWER